MNSPSEGQTGTKLNGVLSDLCMVLGALSCEECAKCSFIEGWYLFQ